MIFFAQRRHKPSTVPVFMSDGQSLLFHRMLGNLSAPAHTSLWVKTTRQTQAPTLRYYVNMQLS